MYKITSAILALGILFGAGTMATIAQAKTDQSDHHSGASTGGYVCHWNFDYGRMVCTAQ